jgi:hypothetical protein
MDYFQILLPLPFQTLEMIIFSLVGKSGLAKNSLPITASHCAPVHCLGHNGGNVEDVDSEFKREKLQVFTVVVGSARTRLPQKTQSNKTHFKFIMRVGNFDST